MRVSAVLGLLLCASQGFAAGRAVCRTEIVEGTVTAGQPLVRPIGNGLLLALQPIRAGWIVRVLPVATRPADVGQAGFHDYAELATPPYLSVTPLSLSTDFAFRAQDAVGWNPRRFRFADSPASYARLLKAYEAFEQAGAPASGPIASALAAEVAQASEGVLTILDAQLTAGTADQGIAAAAVSANFTSTAHTLVEVPQGQSSPLGKLVALSFRVELELPGSFRAVGKSVGGNRLVTHVCGTR